MNFAKLSSKELMEQVYGFYFDLVALKNAYKPKAKIKNEATLNSFNAFISETNNVLEMPASLAKDFIQMSCSLARDDFSAKGDQLGDPKIANAIHKRAAWLCSFILDFEGIDDSIRVQPIGLWISTTLHLESDLGSPDELLTRYNGIFEGYNIDKKHLLDQIKTQIIFLYAQKFPSSDHIEVIKTWCGELMEDMFYRKFLIYPAKTLGVTYQAGQTKTFSVPQPTESDAQEESQYPQEVPKDVDAEHEVSLRIWPQPQVLAAGDFQNIFPRILFRLGTCKSLSKANIEAVSKLTPDGYTSATSALVLVSVAKELWQDYWSNGNKEYIKIIGDICTYIYSLKRTNNYVHKKNDYLHILLYTQIVDLIYTTSIDALIKELPAISKAYSTSFEPNSISAGIIQAHVGEFQYLKKANDGDRLSMLKDSNLDDLKSLYNSYIKSMGRTDFFNVDVAWKLIFPHVSKNDDPAVLLDTNFRETIRKGSHEEIYYYISKHVDNIADELQLKLNIKLNADALMQPEGVVFTQNKMRHPDFDYAISLLKEKQFETSASKFNQLHKKLTHELGINISRNYEAYCLAKNGELLNARSILEELVNIGCPYPQVYWNNACCLQNELISFKLESLKTGLKYAPHPLLLKGTIYLALLLNDNDTLKEWLPCLTFSEAIAYLYYLKYADLDLKTKDALVLTLNKYLSDPIPLLYVDPSIRNLNNRAVDTFIDTIFDRKQTEAIEFWLKCRHLVAPDKYDYWEQKVDYLEKTGRKRDAADSFKEELKCRVSYVTKASKSPQQARHVADCIKSTRFRLNLWLKQCMQPELKTIGQQIYNIANAASRAPEFQNNRMFDFKVVQYFDTREQHRVSPAPPARDEDESRKDTSMFHSLETLVAKIGGQCRQSLKSIHDVIRLASDFEELRSALYQNKHKVVADALFELLDAWERARSTSNTADSALMLTTMKSALAKLKGLIQRELQMQLQNIFQQTLDAFETVNRNYATMAYLLPEIQITPISKSYIPIDFENSQGVFSVRISASPASSPAVKIVSAHAKIANNFEFECANNLNLLPVLVDGESPAILSFEIKGIVFDDEADVRIDIKYEFSGAIYAAESVQLLLKKEKSPSLPSSSPYRYGRPLDISEIPVLFFGRDEEKKKILESVKDGQQHVKYIEGIRRVGKSSLLSCLEHEIKQLSLPIIPIRITPDLVNDPAVILYNILSKVLKHPELNQLDLNVIELESFRSNLGKCYDEFVEDLNSKLGGIRILLMVDDFQLLVEAANISGQSEKSAFKFLLNKIRENINIHTKLLWIFAGQVPRGTLIKLLPGALFWGDMISLHIDFLTCDSIRDIFSKPISSSGMLVPEETVKRMFSHTAGHPECAQQLADYAYHRMISLRSDTITPHDIDVAATDLAKTSDTFADTWYPVSELNKGQHLIMKKLITSIPIGGKIDRYKLKDNSRTSEEQDSDIEDLIARKILNVDAEGQISVRALVLELWLRRIIPQMSDIKGSVAIFIDVANLTSGTGRNIISDLEFDDGEERIVQLQSIIDAIEQYSAKLSPLPISAKYAVNYPKGSSAILTCTDNNYYIENIPDDLFKKGSDDTILMLKMQDVERMHQTVTDFVIVTGDKDYFLPIERLLIAGKKVHLISRKNAMARPDKQISFGSMARRFPSVFCVNNIEHLIS